jgi:tRNA-dihydrouridine synthase
MRIGVSESLPTFLKAGLAAEAEGAAALTLHARNADQVSVNVYV